VILFGLMSLMAALGSKRAREPVQDLQLLLMMALVQGVSPKELHRQLVEQGSSPPPGPWNEAVLSLKKEETLAELVKAEPEAGLRMAKAVGSKALFVSAMQANMPGGQGVGTGLPFDSWIDEAIVDRHFDICLVCGSPDVQTSSWLSMAGWVQTSGEGGSPVEDFFCPGCDETIRSLSNLDFSEPVTLAVARDLVALIEQTDDPYERIYESGRGWTLQDDAGLGKIVAGYPNIFGVYAAWIRDADGVTVLLS
jgi:hypothetical protein